MARKSVFNEGKFEGYSVQQLIDLKEYNYIRWCYYNMSMLSFLPDILDEVCITEEWRIDKPGTNHDKYEELAELKRKQFNILLHNISQNDTKKACTMNNRIKARKRNHAFIKYISERNADRNYYSKAAMQSRNHGRY